MKEFLDRAKVLATKWHQGQTRKGENVPYIVHPERVVNTLFELRATEPKITATVLAAAWLHDILEDTQVTEEEIVAETSVAVLWLVRELTNPSKSFVPTDEHFRMPRGSIRRIKKQLDRDHLEKVSWEAKLIKLVDRLDNVTDMKGMDKDFCVLYAQESQQLLDVLRGTHKGLEEKLESAIRELRKRHD
jgi:(p)ppGpp synthase/HD superfamily hydrolase